MEQKKNKSLANLGLKSFISGLIVIVCLMIFTYVLTFVLKPGQYIEGTAVYQELSSDAVNFTFWKFLGSPILILGAEGSGLLIAIIAFLLIIGGIFEALNKCDFIQYLLKKLVNKFYTKRYALIYIVVLFFMLLGSFVGSFEEVIPITPFVCALAVSLGFDNLIGLGMSLLAAGSGFASGIMNPFTVGIAQTYAEVPLFSGVWLRIVTFIVIYAILTTFLLIHAKRLDKKNINKKVDFKNDYVPNKYLDKAVLCFAIILGSGFAIVISSSVLTFLQDYTLPIIALSFLVGGIVSCAVAKLPVKDFFKSFGKGVVSMLPAILMILLASSIRYILEESQRLDTLVYNLINLTDGLSPYILILYIYLIVLLTEIFVSSGSAKAMLIMPIIIPLANAFNIPLNLVVLAYIFGDGFSNYLYPTNAGLLITLNLCDYSYPKYFKDTWIYHLLTLIVTCLILVFGLAVGYC